MSADCLWCLGAVFGLDGWGMVRRNGGGGGLLLCWVWLVSHGLPAPLPLELSAWPSAFV